MGRENRIITILGRKGSGKSTLAGRLLPEFSRLVILDYLGEYDAPMIADDVKSACRKILSVQDQPAFKIACRVPVDDGLDLLELCNSIGRLTVVLEETSLYCRPTFLPPQLETIVRYGRHRSVSLVCIARRPSEVNREITAQSDIVCSFQQQEPRDVQYLRGFFGKRADLLPHIPRFRYMLFGEADKAPGWLRDHAWTGAQVLIPFEPPAVDQLEEIDDPEGIDLEPLDTDSVLDDDPDEF